MEKLIGIEELAEQTELTVRECRTLIQKNIIPRVKFGHRTLKFFPSKVTKAIEAFEIRSLGDRNGRKGK
jgi:hypothetical protein